ncbi:hypothetical protein RFH95_10280 [Acinetobacter nosocomialis]|nr:MULTISPECIES: hypothetical protein [Acinetobacter calcoaceticus/baumannii complex]MDQ9040817.1 hypothetical protein [Acinetobacter nosocomialis]MDR9532253.1 hypothetical protein [Acinetobacter nosocomialis]
MKILSLFLKKKQSIAPKICASKNINGQGGGSIIELQYSVYKRI